MERTRVISGTALLARLEELFQRIDSAYATRAADAGFSCEGCDGEACCTVDLILHTYVEKAYLRRAFELLDESEREDILDRCSTVLASKRRDPDGDEYRSTICVLNLDGGCRLYPYRPMICRLAGIPHHIRRPDGRVIESGGCRRFETDIRPTRPDVRIDRTDFYQEMARIEIEAVRALGGRCVSQTVAETLADDDPDHARL